ncbi:MAG: LCP family protein [Patescibacteria group bacterium]|mgnify:CR=1 FL=1
MNDDPRINLLQDHFDLHPDPSLTPWKLGSYFFVTILVGMFVGIGFSFAMTRANWSEISQDSSRGFLQSVASFVTSGDRPLDGESEGRINVVVLGVGGEGHDGPELTDTIIFGSFDPSTDRVGLMSIPRDLTIPMNEHGWRKINHANYFGELENPGNGAAYAARVIGDVLDQDVHYYVKVDFHGFEDFIDALGGVDVYVESGFVDPAYPTDDYLTRTVRFEEGWQHMDGDTALVFARSRHGTNGEGSDFARAKRQQKIILAVKERLFSSATVLNPARIGELIKAVSDNVQTNLSTWEMMRLARYASEVKQDQMQHVVLDTSPDGPLYETTLNDSYVILPKNDDWARIQKLAARLVEPEGTASSSFAFIPAEHPSANVRVSIENGTSINGFAFRASQLLESQGFRIESVANAPTRDFTHTIIYDLSGGAYPAELKALQEYLKADVATTVTGWLFSDNITPRTITLDDEGLANGRASEYVDFLIILGQSSSYLVRQ